jgi:hypothetical protein
MPVVLRIGPYSFLFYSEEGNEPPHIHVRRDENLLKFWLESLDLAYNFGFSPHEMRRIRSLVQENREFLLEKWDEYFRRTIR